MSYKRLAGERIQEIEDEVITGLKNPRHVVIMKWAARALREATCLLDSGLLKDFGRRSEDFEDVLREAEDDKIEDEPWAAKDED